MKRNVCLVPVFILTFMLTGCITVFVPVETPTPAPTAIILSTNPPPTETLVPSPTSVQFAPFCSVDPLAATCSAPKVVTLGKSCIKKVPYTLVALPPAFTFETGGTDLICKDEGIRAGKQNVSCTGQQLVSYDLKVCNPACSSMSLEAGTDHCPDGYGYSSAAGCCLSTSALEDGCVVYKVNIGACP
jgi:hypothetical protein